MNEWDAWLGRAERRSDRLDTALAARFLATFDLAPGGSMTMPQGVHFCLCTPDEATSALGNDGHPRRDGNPDGFLPPVPLPRRMWAGSAITFHRPIAVGDSIERVSRIASITEKSGGSGALVFVEIDHAVHAAGALAVEERQTVVYREAAPSHAALVPPEAGPGDFDLSPWDAHQVLVPDPRLLFRYSALTFNSHRIHYDMPYAREVEGYRGLVVHGPLTSSLLLQLAATQFGAQCVARFAFRGLSPAIAGEPLHLVLRADGDKVDLGAFAEDGRQVTKAEALLA